MPTDRTVTSLTDLPPVIAQPLYNEDGFGMGFGISHPPGVECAYLEATRRCSCGRPQFGAAPSDDPATEPS